MKTEKSALIAQPTGIYFVRITGENGNSQVEKIILQ
jgi:hypothetical protein